MRHPCRTDTTSGLCRRLIVDNRSPVVFRDFWTDIVALLTGGNGVSVSESSRVSHPECVRLDAPTLSSDQAGTLSELVVLTRCPGVTHLLWPRLRLSGVSPLDSELGPTLVWFVGSEESLLPQSPSDPRYRCVGRFCSKSNKAQIFFCV